VFRIYVVSTNLNLLLLLFLIFCVVCVCLTNHKTFISIKNIVLKWHHSYLSHHHSCQYCTIVHLPNEMHRDSKLILYADDPSILITGKTLYKVHNKSVTTLKHISKWFSVNGLSLNMDKIKIIKFDLSHFQHESFQIPYRYIKDDTNIKFLGMHIDKHMNWKTHTGPKTPKLSCACYATRCTYHLTNTDSLIIIYYAYFLSILTYGIIFWGSSTDVKTVFKLQKKAVRIMMSVSSKSSGRPILKKTENPDNTSTIYITSHDFLYTQFRIFYI
jgi:hypothetical protein